MYTVPQPFSRFNQTTTLFVVLWPCTELSDRLSPRMAGWDGGWAVLRKQVIRSVKVFNPEREKKLLEFRAKI